MLNSECIKNIADYLSNFVSNKVEGKTERNYKEFCEDDFIYLRSIHASERAIFNLVIHTESLYIFMMKKTNEFQLEKDFCQNYFHRCFTPFYGFLKKKKGK